MKNYLRFSFITALVLLAGAASAADEPVAIKVKDDQQKSIVVQLKEEQQLAFSIVSAAGDIIYQQDIRSTKPFEKTYNLASFPNGTYWLKFENEQAVTTYQVEIVGGKTNVKNPTISEKLKPVLVRENSVIKLNVENAGKSPIEVVIVNEYNNQLFGGRFTDKAKLSKTFNIEGTDAKELTFIVRRNDQEFVQTLALR